ncbi:hypothetical protein [Sphingomonas bacterium]|uniref:hypothetical protein n=1 Tax=Sphingomonas bacterium TaxID=1895847 RepID=UPI0026122B92|nr:hypothetical protein [Sphingomonas bacterium]MDB5678122.1 hypothetical protein [Sphingomonas bacterium]
MTIETKESPVIVSMSPGWGCAAALAIFNTIFMGLLALAFASGGYSSWQQDLWYRYGSLAFVLIGALVPGAILIVRGRRSARAVIAVTLWMIVVLIMWAGFVFNSGGGV